MSLYKESLMYFVFCSTELFEFYFHFTGTLTNVFRDDKGSFFPSSSIPLKMFLFFIIVDLQCCANFCSIAK